VQDLWRRGSPSNDLRGGRLLTLASIAFFATLVVPPPGDNEGTVGIVVSSCQSTLSLVSSPLVTALVAVPSPNESVDVPMPPPSTLPPPPPADLWDAVVVRGRGRGGGASRARSRRRSCGMSRLSNSPSPPQRRGSGGSKTYRPGSSRRDDRLRHGRIVEDADDDAIDDDIDDDNDDDNDGGCWNVVAVVAEDLHPSLSERRPRRPRRPLQVCMVGLLSLSSGSLSPSWVKSDRSPGSSGLAISTLSRAMFGSVGGSWWSTTLVHFAPHPHPNGQEARGCFLLLPSLLSEFIPRPCSMLCCAWLLAEIKPSLSPPRSRKKNACCYLCEDIL
jgi:hypothetical protein